MELRRIIRLKEGIKEARSRELKEINLQIEALRREISALEDEAESVNRKAKLSFSEGLLFQYRALMSRKRELEKHLHKLEAIREEKVQRLKQAYKDVKALEILRVNRERESTIKKLNLEAQRIGFMHLIRNRFKNV